MIQEHNDRKSKGHINWWLVLPGIYSSSSKIVHWFDEFPQDLPGQATFAEISGSTWTALPSDVISTESEPIFTTWLDEPVWSIREEVSGQITLTVDTAISNDVREEVGALFALATEEHFEDGMESEFSKKLTWIIRKYGNDAVSTLTNLIVGEQVNAEAASEALRWMGYMDHPPTYDKRLWLLEKSLTCSSPIVRDGAILGLSYIDDRHAIPFIEAAIRRECCEELRNDMRQVLSQLNAQTAELKNAS